MSVWMSDFQINDRNVILFLKKYAYQRKFSTARLKEILYCQPEKITIKDMFNSLEFIIKYSFAFKKPFKTNYLIGKMYDARLRELTSQELVDSIHIVNCSICAKDKKTVKKANYFIKNYKLLSTPTGGERKKMKSEKKIKCCHCSWQK